jgi:hypothetical protein
MRVHEPDQPVWTELKASLRQSERRMQMEPAPRAEEASSFRRDLAVIAAGFLAILTLLRVLVAALAG